MVGRVLSNPILWEFALGTIACILYEKCLARALPRLLRSCALLIFVSVPSRCGSSPEDWSAWGRTR